MNWRQYCSPERRFNWVQNWMMKQLGISTKYEQTAIKYVRLYIITFIKKANKKANRERVTTDVHHTSRQHRIKKKTRESLSYLFRNASTDFAISA